jgi:hypothetical protein
MKNAPITKSCLHYKTKHPKCTLHDKIKLQYSSMARDTHTACASSTTQWYTIIVYTGRATQT